MMKDNNMNITITGMIGKHQRKEKALLKEAAEFFANQLMDPRMVRKLTLDIEVYNNLDVEGECVDEDGVRNPRWFTIGLKGDQDIGTMIKTLGHEMVHVKQHAKNELQTGHAIAARGGLKIYSKWMGEVWKAKRKEDDYFDSPWEIEAYGREVGLFAKWVQYKGN
jgi:hypothetical protein